MVNRSNSEMLRGFCDRQTDRKWLISFTDFYGHNVWLHMACGCWWTFFSRYFIWGKDARVKGKPSKKKCGFFPHLLWTLPHGGKNPHFLFFSSAHFGRTLESTLSVTHVMLWWWPLLNWDICLNIFVLICLNFFVKNCANILVKNCANIFGQKLCKYFW